jgi:hypothetical protein
MITPTKEDLMDENFSTHKIVKHSLEERVQSALELGTYAFNPYTKITIELDDGTELERTIHHPLRVVMDGHRVSVPTWLAIALDLDVILNR